MNDITSNPVDNSLSVNKKDPYAILSLAATIYIAILGDQMNGALSVIALILFFSLITKPKYLIGPLVFATVFDDKLIAFSGQSFSRFLCIYLIVGTFFSNQNRQNKLSKGSMSILLLMLMGIVLSFHGIYGYTSFPVGYVFGLLQTLILLNFHSITGEELKETLFQYAIISLLYCIYITVQNGLGTLLAGERALIAGVNANQLAFGVAVVSSIFFSHFVVGNFQKKMVHVVLIMFSLLCIFLTGSRTCLIACIVSSIIILLIAFYKQNRRFSAIVIVMMVVALMLVLIYSYLMERYPDLMNRFTIDSVTDSSGTHRVDIWETYFDYYFSKYWLFGIGFDPLNMFYAIEAQWTVGHGAHNLIVDILSVSGVFGVLVYTVFFSKCIRLFLKSASDHLDILVPLGMLICVLITGIGEDVLRAKMTWLCAGFGFAAINGDKKEMADEHDKQ